MLHREIIEKDLAGEVADEELEAHFAMLPEQYFHHYDAQDICRHIRLVSRLLVTITTEAGSGELTPVVNWTEDNTGDASVVTVATWDREGLFYKIAGALTASDINIRAGKSVTREDQIAIMTFVVVGQNGGIVLSEELRDRFSTQLVEILVHNRDIDPKRCRRTTRAGTPEKVSRKKIQTLVAVFREIETARIIVEIEALDRIGLLYEIGKILFRHKLNIAYARVVTRDGIAGGKFYLVPVSTGDRRSDTRLEKLRADLMQEVTTP